MKEARSIIIWNTIAVSVLLVAMLVGQINSDTYGLPIALLFLSIGLCLLTAVMTIIYWKKIGIGVRILGVSPFILYLILIAMLFYEVVVNNMD